MDEFQGFQSPNYTEAPNEFFDLLLAKIDKLCELKVTLAAIRQTFGWHRTQAELSISFFEKATGMSRTSVRDGIALALERGTLIKVREETNHEGAVYAVAMSDDVKQRTVGGSKSEGQNLTTTIRGSKSAPPRDTNSVSQNLTPKKKEIEKEIKERDVPNPQNQTDANSQNALQEPTDSQQNPKEDVILEIKSLFTIPGEMEWDWLDALLLEIPDKTFLENTAHRVSALCPGIFPKREFMRVARFDYARPNR
jgi:hypothetical protein